MRSPTGQQWAALAGTSDEVFHELRESFLAGHAALSAGGTVEERQVAYEGERERLREARSTGVVSDRSRELLEAAGIPVIPRRPGPVVRRRHRSLQESRSMSALGKLGVPVVDEPVPDMTPREMAEALASGMKAEIDRVSPIPLAVAVGDDGLPTPKGLQDAYDMALEFADEVQAKRVGMEGVPLKGDPPAEMVESARKIREGAAARRRASERSGR